MATIQEHSIQWHEGEIAMQRLLNGPHYNRPNPTSTGLSQAHAYRIAVSPLAAFGALDRKGRPWTTVLGGSPQFAQAVAPGVLGVQSIVDLDYDPVVDALFGGDEDNGGAKGNGELQRPGPEYGPIMAGLSINLITRDRVKLAGRMIAGAVSMRPDGPVGEEGAHLGRIGKMQLSLLVQEALGNCPKYLNQKRIMVHKPRPQLVYDSDKSPGPLPRAGFELIEGADLFFLSSTDGKTMDTNHRGGSPGFLRVADEGGQSPNHTALTLVYPEFSGNRLYQTLGNLKVNPLVGVVIPDFETGNVVYLTGRTKILVGPEARAYLPHTKLAVRIEVERTIFVTDGLPFRGETIDFSPYNPPVQPLLCKALVADEHGTVEKQEPIAMAIISGRQVLSPSIARFTFILKATSKINATQLQWQAGQYITLDFGTELDLGWSHMRDDDPQSLNDDFVRTFTISSPPPSPPSPHTTGPLKKSPPVVSIELTLRRHGPVTKLLWRRDLRVPLETPVLAFGGDRNFHITSPRHVTEKAESQEAIFIASGIGITPILAQAPRLLSCQGLGAGVQLRVLWSLRTSDLSVAADSFDRISGLAKRTTVFATDASVSGEPKAAFKGLEEMGAVVVTGRRIQKVDIIPSHGGDQKMVRRRLYICTGPKMLADIQRWLPNEDMVWENFGF
ncbi:uncharacterized protein SPSK_01073 [Sporothrix schenckii 1099-18]|uniref:FAD-binding FR-type domain-containing protein n=1 Tax=Sporothrix schenckii 1099-18 TaxID=1397361 RepID=A0A0F2LZ74_SPOSC|nr:uncharacterized protein SPSK_01073 [Sporothrix schenckii 1099-18]KJR81191.1 hypothetical protein SPSK_01073 [Sporothrix schenckii 1099-18]